MTVFWVYFHLIIVFILVVINTFTEIINEKKEIHNNEKYLDDKKEYYIGEKIMMIVIVLFIIFTILFWVSDIIVKNITFAIWFCVVFGAIYVYIAVKQIIKMIFISEKRVFSYSDLKDFIYTYIFWWFIVLVVISIELEGDKLDKLGTSYGEIVKVGMLLLWYYFNILYSLGGIYTLLYYLQKIWKNLLKKFNLHNEKITNIINKFCDLGQRQEKHIGLKSFRLWKENNGRGVAYKIFMTIPLLMRDILRVICLLVQKFVEMAFMYVVVLIFDPIKVLYKFFKNLWNRHENNEWIYLFAQIAGLFSYVIVFLIIQYGEYGEVTKEIYEFAGTIVLIPYFISKIVSVNKNSNDVS